MDLHTIGKPIGKATAALFIIFGWQLLGIIIGAILVGLWSLFYEGINLQHDIMGIGLLAGDILALWYFLKRKKIPIHWGNIKKDDQKSTILNVLIMGLGLIVIFSYLEEFLSLNMPPELDDLFNVLSFRLDGILSICIFGPIVEELALRGVVLPNMLVIFKKPWLAIFVTAMLFGMIHMNIAQMIGAVLAGIILSWLAYQTGSLIPSILLHILNNSISTLLQWIAPDVKLLSDIPYSVNLILLIAGIILFSYGIKKLYSLFVHYDTLTQCEPEKLEVKNG